MGGAVGRPATARIFLLLTTASELHNLHYGNLRWRYLEKCGNESQEAFLPAVYAGVEYGDGAKQRSSLPQRVAAQPGQAPFPCP